MIDIENIVNKDIAPKEDNKKYARIVRFMICVIFRGVNMKKVYLFIMREHYKDTIILLGLLIKQEIKKIYL